MIAEDKKIRAFKVSVKRRAFLTGLVLIAVSSVLRRIDVTLGLLFGLCVGFINFNLMCRQNQKILKGSQKGSGRRAAVSFLIRYLILAAAGAAVVLKKNLHPIAALVGFFVLHFTLITYEFTESLRKRFLSVEKSD